MQCPQCGAQNAQNATQCFRCGYSLHSSPPMTEATTPATQAAPPIPDPTRPPAPVQTMPQTSGSEPLSGLIPYKNTSALIAYYLGVFSIIPCLGIFLGIAAFILGIIGLRFARAHPEAKGKVHA